MPLDAQQKAMLKQAIGMTDADANKVGPNIQKILARFPDFQKYQFVAEVVDAKYCFAGVKKGQKYVFASAPPMILTDQSDCPLCLRALGPLTPILGTMMERVAEGLDPNPGVFQVAECLDPGLERGGLGKVVFRVYAQKAK